MSGRFATGIVPKMPPTMVGYDVPIRDRPGGPMLCRIVVPSDLSQEEAEHLAAFLRAVAFPDSAE